MHGTMPWQAGWPVAVLIHSRWKHVVEIWAERRNLPGGLLDRRSAAVLAQSAGHLLLRMFSFHRSFLVSRHSLCKVTHTVEEGWDKWVVSGEESTEGS